MKQNRIIALSAAIALTFAIATPAAAQFGNLLEKAKSKVKEKVENTVERAVDDATDAAIDTAKKKTQKAVKDAAEKAGVNLPVETLAGGSENNGGTQVSGGMANLHNSHFKPSQEALANDKMAGSATVLDHFSRSIGDIHAAYEHLDPKLFPLQPYWKYPSFYMMHDGRTNVIPSNSMVLVFKSLLSGKPVQQAQFDAFGPSADNKEFYTPDGQPMGVFPDDLFRYAFTAQFLADPTGYLPLDYFGYVLAYRHPLAGPRALTKYDDETNGIVNAQKQWMAPTMQYPNRQFERESQAVDVARSVTPISLLYEYNTNKFIMIERANTALQRALCALVAVQVYDLVTSQHKDFNAADAKARELAAYVARYKGKERMFFDDYRAENMPPVPMPQGVAVSSDIKAKGDECGRKLAADRGEEFVKVVFTGNSWKQYKEPNWPYRVMGSALPCVLVTRTAGKDYIIECSLQKNTDGSTYFMSANDGERKPVKQ